MCVDGRFSKIQSHMYEVIPRVAKRILMCIARAKALAIKQGIYTDLQFQLMV